MNIRPFKALALLTIGVLVFSSSRQPKVPNDALKLRFSSPAAMWEETLPLGNGRLGAMPDGSIDRELIVLNEESMWSGSEWDPANPEAAKWLPVIREELKKGNNLEAQKLTYEHFVCSGRGGSNPRYGCYQTLGKLEIDYGPMSLTGEDYHRELSLRNAVAKTVCKGLKREYFVSLTDDVMVMRLKSKGEPLNFQIYLTRPKESTSAKDGENVSMWGKLSSGEPGADGVRYYCEARVLRHGRKEAVILLSAATDYQAIIDGKAHKDDKAIRERVRKTLDAASQYSYKELRSRHIAEHRKYFDRVEVQLGKSTKNNGIAPVDSAALYMQFGRYLFIGSTAKATLPPNLQGIWADAINTSWSGDYHLNINIQMNHWPMEPGNLSDLYEPVTHFVEGLVPSGEKTARDFYGTDGWAGHVLANAWHFTSPAENPSWGASFTGGAWLALQLWEHYQFSMDKAYLKRIYPTLKGAAEFLRSNLFELPGKGWLVSGPSTSPENGFIVDGQTCYVCAGPVMDTQICQEIFGAVCKAAETLGIDSDYAKLLKETSAKLPPMQVAPGGYLQEWLEDYKEMDVHHRHVSHLFGLYPGTTINSPELQKAARATLDRRGDEGTGWSRAWKINFWARLGDGNRAYKLYRSLMNPVTSFYQKPDRWGSRVGYTGAGTFPNMFCSHPPFQIDGNFGGSAGIMEMLLQSHEVLEDGTRVISVLPAIPDAWSSGSFKGLKARGNITVDCSWRDGKITSLDIQNPDNTKIVVRKMQGTPSR